MTETEPFRTTVRSMLRERLFDVAAEAFAEEGWQKLTMATIAKRAGVSRQTVYNEFGTKPQLAELLVMRELDTFLAVVRRNFLQHDDFVVAVRAAIEGALEASEESALLRAVLESGHNGDSELLPFITQSQGLIDTATDFLILLVEERFPEIPLRGERLTLALETVVRLVLSHVTQPSRSPSETADGLAWIIGAVVGGASVG